MLSLWLLAAAAAPLADADVYAVVVGYNGGRAATAQRPELSALRFADDDALKLARWLTPLAAPGHLWVLTEPDASTQATLNEAHLPLPASLQSPTRANLFATFDALQSALDHRASSRPAVVYFYYAGHGLSGELVLKPERSDAAGLSGHELRVRLAGLHAAQVTVFIDACRAASLFVERGASGPDLSAGIDELEHRSNTAHVGVLTATQSDHPAGEASDLQGGFFSHVLASGLAGGADVDGDERVSFGELAAFVAFNTERLTGQRPWFEAPAGDLKASVVDLHGRAQLRMPPEAAGRFRVVATSGTPVSAEVNKAPGRPLSLTLPAGQYQVLRFDDADHARAARFELSEGEVRELPAFGDAVSVTRAAERGEVDWQSRSFQTPFSVEAVAALETGFVSGQPAVTTPSSRVALDASYLVSPAPFALPGLEHGGEIGARVHFGSLLVGARFAARSAVFSAGTLVRLGLHAQVGWRWQFFTERLGLTVSGLAGMKSIFLKSQADFTAPSLAGDVRIEGRLAPSFSVWADGRFEAAWVNLDGARTPFAEPSFLLGVSLWL